MRRNLVVTIDGPSGLGKSTVCKALSEKLSYIYLDTGALYRALAYKADRCGLGDDDETGLQELCCNISIHLKPSNQGIRIIVDGEDVTMMIREEKIGFLASKISAIPFVRQALLPIQREMGRKGGIVAEGRDMGTVVFPDADVKFFLDAELPEKARRRYLQLMDNGVNVEYEKIKRDIEKRDKQDSTRELAPLKPSEDSFCFDTTTMTAEEVVGRMLEIITEFIESGNK